MTIEKIECQFFPPNGCLYADSVKRTYARQRPLAFTNTRRCTGAQISDKANKSQKKIFITLYCFIASSVRDAFHQLVFYSIYFSYFYFSRRRFGRLKVSFIFRNWKGIRFYSVQHFGQINYGGGAEK